MKQQNNSIVYLIIDSDTNLVVKTLFSKALSIEFITIEQAIREQEYFFKNEYAQLRLHCLKQSNFTNDFKILEISI